MRKVVPGSTSRLTIVDHNETYGRHILKHIAKKIKADVCVDLGCGNGDDLENFREFSGCKNLIGVDFGRWNSDKLENKGIKVENFDIEKENFPFENNAIDFIIANQVMEHCKEIYWINNEIFRSLKIGGYLFIGVPNICSLHNRILNLFGFGPSQWKSLSAHVRPFSKRDIIQFYTYIGGGGMSKFLEIKHFYGSQFYPFPKFIARPLATILPNMAFSIFFLIQKVSKYENEFLEFPKKARLETNFWVGKT